MRPHAWIFTQNPREKALKEHDAAARRQLGNDDGHLRRRRCSEDLLQGGVDDDAVAFLDAYVWQRRDVAAPGPAHQTEERPLEYSAPACAAAASAGGTAGRCPPPAKATPR